MRWHCPPDTAFGLRSSTLPFGHGGSPQYCKQGMKADLDMLNVPRVRTAVGSRAFSVAAPRLWNELPLEIRSAKTQTSFRKKLKTYFFGQAFPT